MYLVCFLMNTSSRARMHPSWLKALRSGLSLLWGGLRIGLGKGWLTIPSSSANLLPILQDGIGQPPVHTSLISGIWIPRPRATVHTSTQMVLSGFTKVVWTNSLVAASYLSETYSLTFFLICVHHPWRHHCPSSCGATNAVWLLHLSLAFLKKKL